jgi:endonuclease YncB( thermonuclease family)
MNSAADDPPIENDGCLCIVVRAGLLLLALAGLAACMTAGSPPAAPVRMTAAKPAAPTPEPLPAQPAPGITHSFKGRVVSVHDADTLDVTIFFDNRVAIYAAPIRMLGVYGVELASPNGKAARDHLAELLPVGTDVTIQLSTTGTGSTVTTFERLVARLWKDKQDINADHGAWLKANNMWGGTGS